MKENNEGKLYKTRTAEMLSPYLSGYIYVLNKQKGNETNDEIVL